MACLVGCAAIAGLPPLAGFASELLLYLAAYRATAGLDPTLALPAVVTIAGLALIGGLAAACFSKLFGIAFLGEPRTDRARQAGEPGPAMQGVLIALAAIAVVLGLAAPVVIRGLEPVLVQVTALPSDAVRDALAPAVTALRAVAAVCTGAALAAAALALVRARLLSARTVTKGPTWDCGYAAPSPRMQYTGSSFAQPLMAVFGRVVPSVVGGEPPKGFFPGRASFASATPDPGLERVYAPLFRGIARVLARFRWLQHGRVQLYVLYIALTLVTLLLWRIGLG
jgi:NADH:ubiquinone oxidoreductase subunit 5 (subunit L)/multisubunit Na+/H+ antiporter MnhA subunit